MFTKLLSLGLSGMLGLALAAAFPPPPPDDGPPPPPPKGKKKEDRGPNDLRKAYDLLRRIKNDNRASGRPEERLRDWTERAAAIYRDGVKAAKEDDRREAREYGAAAHDLARAVGHARDAAIFDRTDSDFDADLPQPPDGPGPDGEKGRVVRDLRAAHDRIRDQLDDRSKGKDARFYEDAARDLYNAARRDAEAGRLERAGELARAAEAMSHVNEHLARARGEDDRPEPRKKGEAKEKEKEKRKKEKEKKDEDKAKRKRPEPRDERPEPGRDGDDLPPPL